MSTITRRTFPAMAAALGAFVDLGGHGYSLVHATSQFIETEFVCIPRPLERSERPDGGAASYRVKFRTGLWQNGESTKLQMQILEGDPKFSL